MTVFKMKKGNYLIELAVHIPLRNVNFYLDVCHVMSAIDLNEIWCRGEMSAEIEKLKSVITDGSNPQEVIQLMVGYLTCTNRKHSPCGLELLGHIVLKHVLQREESSGEHSGASKLPFIFTAYSIAQDLIFHGYGPNYSFVGKVLDALAKNIAANPDFPDLDIRNICARYTYEDIAAIFLGYSFVINRAPRPIVPFPAHSAGFPAFILFEMKMLFPRIFQVMNLSK